MKENYISIIIPCYNVEKYISNCIDSILAESFKNYEIILVDDCSTDNTLKILKKYEEKYDNITVLQNKVNSGAGASRNNALKIAKYDLISFIDSDDYIESNYHEELLKSMIEEKSDISICDIYTKYDEDFDTDVVDFRSSACEGKVSKKNIINNGYAASPCNKLLKKSILLNNLFPEGIMNEDVASIIGYIIDCKKISYTTNTYYTYIQHKNSVQNDSISEKRFDIFKSIEILEERKKNNKEFVENLDALLYNQIILFYVYVIPKDKDFVNRYKIVKKFSKLSSKYNLIDNIYFKQFLNDQPRLSKIYYKIMFNLNSLKLALLSNLIIEFYQFYKHFKKRIVIKENITMDSLIIEAKKQSKKKNNKFTVSVVIPNYNYEKFLYQRIYSILHQTKKINELLILDDCSTDNSRDLIDDIYDKLSPYIDIRTVYNTKNSGSAFKQWRKGFELAKSDYVWIAEADDYCEKSFLKNITKPISKNKNIVLSYCDTAYINKEGYKILKTIKPEIDIMKTGHWDKNYINNGVEEIKNYSYLNCTIANVSSVLFKKQDYSNFFELSGKYKQAGDWLFYINVIKCGDVAFCNKPLNYYRLHGNNVTSTNKKQAQFNEIKKIHEYIRKEFKLNSHQENEINKRYKFLEKVWDIEI